MKLIPSRKRRISKDTLVGVSLSDHQRIPRELDWREVGFKTQPENQRDCGSCYAYSIAGSIEGQIFKKTGMLLPLSEQQLVDCSTSTGNLGCSGGSLRNTLRYLEKAKGLMAKKYYPYKAKVRALLFFFFSSYFSWKNEFDGQYLRQCIRGWIYLERFKIHDLHFWGKTARPVSL